MAAAGMFGCGQADRHGAAGMTASAGDAAIGSSGGSAGMVRGGADNLGLQPVPSQMHRLNATEYAATVADVLGPTDHVAAGVIDDELEGFDNDAEVLRMNEDYYARYFDAAKLVAADVFASAAFKARVVTCPNADDATCVRGVISGTGLRLFRRPLLEPELTAYSKVYAGARARGESHESALQQVLTALLASAQFLYRMEFASGKPGKQPLGPFELASRLSYLLWSSAPDDALLAAAEHLAFTEDEQLTSQFSRLFDDAKSARFVASFAGQWLGARRLSTHPVDATVYPDWTPEVAAAAENEVYRYFDDFVHGGLTWPAFLQSHTHYVNGPLAQLYALNASGDALVQVTVDQDQRVGFLGMIGFLSVTSPDRRTSPTQRGKFLLERLWCWQVPPPPASIPKLEPMPEPSSFREKMEQISQNPDCATCHQLLDPLGLALEHYDGIGEFRNKYAAEGVVVDSNVTWPPSSIYPSGATFTGLPDVAATLTSAEAFKTCLIHKVYTYGMGRALSEVDKANVQALSSAWQTGPLTVREALKALVLSAPFRFRSDGDLP
jgi:Protein of unknown function (DUF1592)/Protein of unknown function (DUF1588)/Protein of unknown function (DUF1595)/Protein of unknown function (DUF1585)/Protein of unknown function (DUF1587)